MMTFNLIPQFNRWLWLGLCICLLSLSVGWAQAASPFYWDFINVDIALQSNGDLVVTETQKYTFTADHTNQRYRYIPLADLERITDVTVSEGDRALPTQTGTHDGQFSGMCARKQRTGSPLAADPATQLPNYPATQPPSHPATTPT